MTKKLVFAGLVIAMLAVFTGCEVVPEAVTVTVTATEEIDSNEIPYAKFVYNFNQDVTVDSIHVDFPDTTVLTYNVPDSEIEASYAGDTDYDFPIYKIDGEDDIVYKGTYSLHFWGTRSKDDEPYAISQNADLD